MESLVKDVLASDTFKPLDPKEQEEDITRALQAEHNPEAMQLLRGVSARCFLAAEERQLFPGGSKKPQRSGGLGGKIYHQPYCPRQRRINRRFYLFIQKKWML